MFLAIINDTYAEVKSELAESEDEFAIMDYFKSHYHGLLGKLGKHQDQIEGIQAALKVSVCERLLVTHHLLPALFLARWFIHMRYISLQKKSNQTATFHALFTLKHK